MINITNTMSSIQILEAAHQYTAVPSLIILFISFSILFLLSGLILIDHTKSGYGKFFLIWACGNIFGLIILLFLIYSPNVTQIIKDFFLNLFK